MGKNTLIIHSIARNRQATTANPPRIEWQPKNTIDQRLFKVNCSRNTYKALLTPGACTPFRQTRNAAIPIKVNKPAHTGANTQFGGLKAGLWMTAYQSGIARRVKTEPIKPAP